MRFIIGCALILLASLAQADTLYITEFAAAPPTSVYYQAARTPAITDQTVAIGVTSAQSAAFNDSTGLIRIQADIACHVVIGTANPVAVAGSLRLVAGQPEYFVVPFGTKIAVIKE